MRSVLRQILLSSPNAAPALDLRWDNGAMELVRSGGAIPAFTRSATVTRINAAGMLETVPANAQAVDYTAALGWAARSEEQKTNLLSLSEGFGGPWTTTGCTVATDPLTPFPPFSGTYLKEDVNNTNHNLASEPISHNASQVYTLSVFARAGSKYLYLRSPNFINKGASFNLTTGQVAASSADGAGMLALGDGWWRCWITYSGVTASGSVIVGLANTPVTALTPYAGNGSSGVYVFGSQLETGGCSSYFPTVGASAARVADTLSLPISPWWNAAAGTWLVECGALPGSITANNGQRKVLVAGTSFNQLALMLAGFGTDIYPEGFVGNGSSLARAGASVTAAGTMEKLALSYSTTAGSFFARSGQASTNIGNFSGLASGTMSIGDSLNGYLRRIRYWPAAMTAAQISALTT